MLARLPLSGRLHLTSSACYSSARIWFLAVASALFDLDGHSATRCDGFGCRLYTYCWEVISDDVFQATREFMSGVPIPKGIASTMVVLIPKKDSPMSFADFTPISLCTFINKVFTKILSSRLKAVLPVLSHPSNLLLLVVEKSLITSCLRRSWLVQLIRGLGGIMSSSSLIS